jgi:hypothetical protein
MTNEPEWVESFVEKGADIEHDRWARWQKYMFSKGTVDENGVFHLPKDFVDRWFRQIDTPYSELSEPEKESDRKETRNYLPLIQDTLKGEKEKSYRDGLKENIKNSQQDDKKWATLLYCIREDGIADAKAELLSKIEEERSCDCESDGFFQESCRLCEEELWVPTKQTHYNHADRHCPYHSEKVKAYSPVAVRERKCDCGGPPKTNHSAACAAFRS